MFKLIDGGKIDEEHGRIEGKQVGEGRLDEDEQDSESHRREQHERCESVGSDEEESGPREADVVPIGNRLDFIERRAGWTMEWARDLLEDEDNALLGFVTLAFFKSDEETVEWIHSMRTGPVVPDDVIVDAMDELAYRTKRLIREGEA